jgi:hypothetical protein
MRISKEAAARLDGMSYAAKRIKEVGEAEFDKELKWRGAHGIGLSISPEELRDASGKIEDRVYSVLAMCSLMSLHDEFDFEKEDLERYLRRFNEKVSGLNADYVHWDDYVMVLEDETGIRISEITWER